MRSVLPYLQNSTFPAIRRKGVKVLQVSLGYKCNQSCIHCHVNAGPHRTEEMTPETVDQVISFLQENQEVTTLDLTGGAPELNPDFKRLVVAARKLDRHVIDRCNLTILSEPGMEDLAGFLATQQVHIIASLPCYMEDNVDLQRGKGTFAASIKGLKDLNALGYGLPDSKLKLSLVFNPQGASLPPPQTQLEIQYRKHLKSEFDIEFTDLLVITNMPIKRFGATLLARKEFVPYMELLKASYDSKNLHNVMCRDTLNVDWQGFVYDCDFNQQLNMPLGAGKGKRHLSEISVAALRGEQINVADHCYGCTAGQGSSCTGALKA